jgi:hypothetical protein
MKAQATSEGVSIDQLLSFQSITLIELFVASLLPAAAMLLVGTIGTRLLLSASIGPFVLIFLFGAVAIFLGEFFLISTMQKVVKGQFFDLIDVCHAYVAGNKARRATIHENEGITTALAKALNALLDSIPQQGQQEAFQTVSPVQSNEGTLQTQLKQLIREIAPVIDADLRVKMKPAAGDIGKAITIYHYLINELIQHIRQTRAATDQITSATREIIDRSIELANTSETLILSLSQTTEKAEQLVAFIQRLGSTLQLCVDITHDTQTDKQRKIQLDDTLDDTLKEELPEQALIVDSISPESMRYEQLKADMREQSNILEQALNATQEHTVIAESIIGELYSFAQSIHHSSTDVLHTTEKMSSFVALAKQWRHSVTAFHLPEDDDQNYPYRDEANVQPGNFSPKEEPLSYEEKTVIKKRLPDDNI